MPVNKEVNLRYRTLIRCLRNQVVEYDMEALIEACNRVLRENDFQEVSERTIRADINSLQHSPFDIELDEKQRSGHKRLYRMVDPSYKVPGMELSDMERDKAHELSELLIEHEGEPQYDWLRVYLSALSAGCLDAKQTVVQFQGNSDAVEAAKWFEQLMMAIINKRTLELTYEPFRKEKRMETVYPYRLRQFNERWFLIGRREGFDNIALYGLERIMNIKECSDEFKECLIDIDEYFEDMVGMSRRPDSERVDILLKVSRARYDYISTKPIVGSMTELKDKSNETHVAVMLKKVIVNRELVAMLLSFGADVEVVEPLSLREEMMAKLTSMNDLYNIADTLQG